MPTLTELIAYLVQIVPTPATGLAYIAGCLGIVLEWLAYRSTSQQAFRLWSASGAVLWAVQYALVDARTAAITMACTAVRTLASASTAIRHHHHLSAMTFTALFSGLTAISWQGWISLLPAFAVINTTLALFYLDNRPMRLAVLASSIAWIGNDIYWKTWPALFAESIAVIINLHTIRRLGNPSHRVSDTRKPT